MSGEQLDSSGLGSASCIGSVPGNWSGLGSLSVCIITCVHVLYEVSELFLWPKSSEKSQEQKEEEEKEEFAWQVRRCGYGINDGCVCSYNCNIVVFTHASWLAVCGLGAL